MAPLPLSDTGAVSPLRTCPTTGLHLGPLLSTACSSTRTRPVHLPPSDCARLLLSQTFTSVNTLVYLKGGHVGTLNSAHLTLFGYPDWGVFHAFSLRCQAKASGQHAKTGHGPHYSHVMRINFSAISLTLTVLMTILGSNLRKPSSQSYPHPPMKTIASWTMVLILPTLGSSPATGNSLL